MVANSTIKRFILGTSKLFSHLTSSRHAKRMIEAFEDYFGIKIPPTLEEEGDYYALIREFPLLGNTYYLFVDENKHRQVMFRKDLVEDGIEYFAGLDNMEELDRLVRCYKSEIFEAIFEWEKKYDVRTIELE